MQFVIFHGSFGTPHDNWFEYLRVELEKLGQTVFTPAFPVDSWDHITKEGKNTVSNIQNLSSWTHTFEHAVLPKLNRDEEICFIGHSIACVFILEMVEQFALQLNSAIFVAPFLTHLGKDWQIDTVNQSFYKTDFDDKNIQKLLGKSYAIYSDNDPYVPLKNTYEFLDLVRSERIEIPDGKHFNSDAGYTTFPFLLSFCKTTIL